MHSCCALSRKPCPQSRARGALSHAPQPSQPPNPVATHVNLSQHGAKQTLSRQKALRGLSQQRFPYHDRKHYEVCRDREFPVAMKLYCRACPRVLGCTQGTSRARYCAHRAPVARADARRCATLSGHRKPCHDTGPRNSVATDFLYRNKGLKTGSSPFWPPALPVPPFLFFFLSFPKHPKFNIT